VHVVVPLNPGCAWEVVKPFARGFAETLATLHPADYVATATKNVRAGRIFVDYLRNGRGATSVASNSLRSRPGAPVAFPVPWSELGKYHDAAAFDIETAQRRLARMRKSPWEGIEGIRQDLDRVSRQLEQTTRRKT
jgi:bifunctional non-homologous end joining protein LigD